MLTAYYIALGLSFVAALWLNVRALPHICVLGAWVLASVYLDLIQRPELKLFLDFFGAHAVLFLTLTSRRDERLSACAWLSFTQVTVHPVAWGASELFALWNLSFEVFARLLFLYGWLLNVLFIASVLVLVWGVNIRERFLDLIGAVARLGLGGSGRLAPQKARPRTSSGHEHTVRLGTRTSQARSDLHVSPGP